MSSFPNIDFNQIIRQLEAQQKQANEANLARYGQLMDHVGGLSQQIGSMGTYGQAIDQVNQIGDSARVRIDEAGTRQGALATQDLTSRGLGNTTITQSAERGVQSDVQRSHQELDERLAAQRSGILERQAGMEFNLGNLTANAMLSRVDQGPDMGLYSQLLAQAGAAGDGSKINTFVPNSPNSSPGFGERATTGATAGSGGGRSGATSGTRSGAMGGNGRIITNPGAGGGGLAGYGGGGGGAAGGATSAGGGLGVGQAGSAFDNMFLGQDVFSGGGTIGTYGGGGTTNLTPGQNLLGANGQIDPNRIPQEQGGTAATPKKKTPEEEHGCPPGTRWFAGIGCF